MIQWEMESKYEKETNHDQHQDVHCACLKHNIYGMTGRQQPKELLI